MPSFKGAYDTPGAAYRVQVVGNLAYVADFDSGLQILDISNPAAPTLKGSYNTPGNARGIQVVAILATPPLCLPMIPLELLEVLNW
ncbi:hypothetical protein [Dolichospermum circinale]|uniref:hypothetical protein n=1 Tax=Dolichospermum circinale TaxID=109265 RepID=UPI00232BDA33|nr:hypothetical protein [Dolichospermum circinale]MDB9449258.1 hypothetical protein [Dolichospermum circinale CS-547]